MKKILYFVVEKQTSDVGDDIQELTGYNTITLYDIIHNKPKMLDEIEADACNKSETVIYDWLKENGRGDEEFELIQL
jgi:hypothetical protein